MQYGRPFIVLREQSKRTRLHGIEALKSHILAARTVSNIVKTSLGPRGPSLLLPQSNSLAQSTGARGR